MGFRLETGLGGAEAGGAAKTLTRRLGGQPTEKAEELRRRRARRERGRPLPHWCSSAPGSPQTPRPMRAPSLQGPLRPVVSSRGGAPQPPPPASTAAAASSPLKEAQAAALGFSRPQACLPLALASPPTTFGLGMPAHHSRARPHTHARARSPHPPGASPD